jgi:hypothetical protein
MTDDDREYSAWEDLAHCQQGDLRRNGSHTGRVCRKPDQCRREGECYFVAAFQRHAAHCNVPGHTCRG